MRGDLVYVDGEALRWGDGGAPDPESLPGGEFIYQRMHVAGRRILHRDAHIEIAELSHNALYGGPAGVSQSLLDAEVAGLLDANRYPAGGDTEVWLWLLPDREGGAPRRMLTVKRQLLYPGYELWHKPLKVVATPYEPLFSPHNTGASLAAHRYARGYARRKGADVAITVNYQGVVTGAGQYPFFAVAGNEMLTSPFESGVPESVERRLGIAAGIEAGLLVLEQPIEAGQLRECDELFYITPQGPVSIGRYEDGLFPGSMARRVAEAMNRTRL